MEEQFPTPKGRRRLAKAEAFAWAEDLLGVVKCGRVLVGASVVWCNGFPMLLLCCCY